MKKTVKTMLFWIVFIIILMASFGICAGCQEAENSSKNPNIKPSNIKPLSQHLVQVPQNWKDAYGDALESQVAYNLVVLRNNQLVIADVMNRIHPKTDPNETEWIGCPSIANPDDYFLNQGYRVDVQIGLRQDGIVIWRESDPNLDR